MAAGQPRPPVAAAITDPCLSSARVDFPARIARLIQVQAAGLLQLRAAQEDRIVRQGPE
jgi:hypothetical protein